MASKVWCRLIDDDRKFPGTAFKVSLEEDSNIDDLRKGVIREAWDHRLELWDLTVWRCTDKSIALNRNVDDRVREIFTDKKAENLDPTSKIADLDLSPREILLVQVSGERWNSKRKRDEGDGETGFPSKRSFDRLLEAFYSFHSRSWGQPLSPALTTLPVGATELGDLASENEEDPSDDVLPGDPFLSIMDRRFLVRTEYIRAFDKVKALYDESSRTHLAVVTGQPGIGKKLWIYYALRRCLGEKQPVILYRIGNLYLFSEAGVDVLSSAPAKEEHTWCFVDSTQADRLPVDIYDPLLQLFPIYVTPPNRDRWSKLHQLRRPALVIMNPWTRAEMETAAALYPERTLDDVSDRFNNAGPSARLCLEYTSTELRAYYNDRDSAINFQAPEHLVNTLLTERDNRLRIDDLSRWLCVVRRSPSDSSRFDVGPISPLIRRRLLTQLWQWKEKDRVDMIQRLSRIPGAGGMTGLLFESYHHAQFAEEIHMDAKPMFRTSHSNSRWHSTFGDFSRTPPLREAHPQASATEPSPIRLSIRPSKVQTYERNEGLVIEEDIYYIPLAENEVSVDSFIVNNGHLYMFRFASGTHHSFSRRLCDTLDRFSGLPDTKNRHLIFVVPDSLKSFNCPHSSEGFLRNHVPYVLQVGNYGIHNQVGSSG